MMDATAAQPIKFRRGRRTAVLACLVLPGILQGQIGYRKPPLPVVDLLNKPSPPRVSLSPSRDRILLIETERYPAIADLARPMVRLAGLRIDPATNGPHRLSRITALTLVNVSDGKTQPIELPSDPHAGSPLWSADGKHIAFTHASGAETELWVAETATGRSKRMQGVRLNAAYGDPVQWMPDQRRLLVQTIPPGRGTPPGRPPVPGGPTVQENHGKKAPAWTFQDLLDNAHDEDLFEYYTASQLALVDIAGGKLSPVGAPSIFQSVDPSPDGRLVLVARLQRPYSYLVTAENFPKEIEVWNLDGTIAHKLASLPLQEQIPADGVAIGPRSYAWRATRPSSVVWVEALDEGDPKRRVPFRDRILMAEAPFQRAAVEVAKTEFRYRGLAWGERGDTAFLTEFDRPTRRSRTWILRPDDRAASPRKLWDRNSQDRYSDPGDLLSKASPAGRRVVLQRGDSVFLTGDGGSPDGDRPFLDRLDLKTLASERLYRCAPGSYESVVDVLSEDGAAILTRRETESEPPNLYVLSGDYGRRRALTHYTDPSPELRRIKKQLVTYSRPDGVRLSFTLYLPPDYRDGDRLPTVVWAYPREYTDQSAAGQVTGSPHRFTAIEGASHLFFLTQGYAVLDNASMPVVGDSQTVNDTYLDQIVASAKAAIDKAVAMGVTDRNRVGVGGHSYGAFMTANLLTHSNLFRAGIARSGAYNRTLTPFGFQSERRTLWEAPELYFRISPFMFAHQLNTPILLIHGELDNNSGTFPVQSERYYHALKGNGKTVRYVTLPFESHGYAARESIEHTLYEMISWFEKYVKNSPASGR